MVILIAPAVRAETTRLTAVVGLLYPLAYLDEEETLTGSVVDIMRLAVEGLPVELHLSAQPFARAIRMAERGEGDLFHFYRAPFLQPYLREVAPVACFRDVVLPRKGMKLSGLKDLHQMPFAYIRGSYFDRQLRTGAGLAGTAVHDIDVMLRIFRAGRVDAVIGNELLLRSFAARAGDREGFGDRHVLTRIVSALYLPKQRRLPGELEGRLAARVNELRPKGAFDQLLAGHAGIPFTSCQP